MKLGRVRWRGAMRITKAGRPTGANTKWNTEGDGYRFATDWLFRCVKRLAPATTRRPGPQALGLPARWSGGDTRGAVVDIYPIRYPVIGAADYFMTE